VRWYAIQPLTCCVEALCCGCACIAAASVPLDGMVAAF